MSKKTKRKKAPEGFFSRNAIWLLIGGLASVIAVVGSLMFTLDRWDEAPEACCFSSAGGASQAEVKTALTNELGMRFGNKVYFLWRLQGGFSARGYYRITRGETALGFARRIAKGRQSPVNVTFNNIRTIPQLTQRLAANLEVSPVTLADTLAAVLSEHGYTRAEFPAAFLPDTYNFYRDVKPRRLIEKLLTVRNDFWTPERTAKARKLGLTPIEVTTLASIVEEETAKKDEMGKVARLYLNRLGRGMKLQADPTVKYAVGDFTLRRIGGPMLQTKSAYNTYVVNGLPPGPIRIPEATTIDAVLNAPEHPYIYMCAREDFSGYHNFATDYATHQDNARRYQAELNRRNIH